MTDKCPHCGKNTEVTPAEELRKYLVTHVRQAQRGLERTRAFQHGSYATQARRIERRTATLCKWDTRLCILDDLMCDSERFREDNPA